MYKLVAKGTVDERIYERAVGKKEKTESLLDSGKEGGEEVGGEGGGGKEISRIVQLEFAAYQAAQVRARKAREREEEEEEEEESGSEREAEEEDDEESVVEVVGSSSKSSPWSSQKRRQSSVSVLESIVDSEGSSDEN